MVPPGMHGAKPRAAASPLRIQLTQNSPFNTDNCIWPATVKTPGPSADLLKYVDSIDPTVTQDTTHAVYVCSVHVWKYVCHKV